MTPTSDRGGRLAAAGLAGCLLAAPAAAQNPVQHRVAFALGADEATVTTTFPRPAATAAMLRFDPHAPRRVDLRAQHRRRTVQAADGAKLPFGDSGWALAADGKPARTVRHMLPLTARRLPTGLGQRDGVQVTVEGKPKVVRYHRGYRLPGATTWLFAPGQEGAPQRVTFDLPEGFAVATTLPAAADGSFHAPDFASLVAAPIHVGRFETLALVVEGRRLRVHLTGFERDRTDREAFVAELTKIVRPQLTALGPGDGEFVFLFGRRTGRRETISYDRAAEILTHSLQSSPAQRELLAAAHARSFFAPFARGADGRVAWFVDGARRYLADLLLARAGLQDPERFWTREVAARIQKHQLDKRRLTTSAAAAGAAPGGLDADLEGWLLALLIDVEIRVATRGTRSLEHVVQDLLRRGEPATNGSIGAACAAAAGRSFAGFFQRFVTGTDENDYPTILAKVGVNVRSSASGKPTKVHPRVPQPSSKRPPRWYVDLAPDANPATVALRHAMTASRPK